MIRSWRLLCLLLAAMPASVAQGRPKPVIPLDGLRPVPRHVVFVEGAFSLPVPHGATAYRPPRSAHDHDHGVVILLPSGGIIAATRAPGDAEFGEDVPCNEHVHLREDGSPGTRTATTLAGKPACDLVLEGPALHRELVEQAQSGLNDLVSLMFITRRADVAGDRPAFNEVRTKLVLVGPCHC